MVSSEFVYIDGNRIDHGHVSAQFRFIKRSTSLEYFPGRLVPFLRVRANVFYVKVFQQKCAPKRYF